jgi:hypothetical protein
MGAHKLLNLNNISFFVISSVDYHDVELLVKLFIWPID